MAAPAAYFLTWTCYGTWLHGDGRSSVDDDHNVPRTARLAHNRGRQALDRAFMKHPPLTLTPQARDLCETVIRKHAEIRGWRLHACAVRTNHIHCVVTADIPPERVMEQFKAWCTRRLREEGHLPSERPAWTEHGSTRWLNDVDSLCRAIDYVVKGQ